MRKVNEYVEELRKQTKKQIREKMKNDKASYKKLLEDLLVQGLIKMMEGSLILRCRQEDAKILE